MSTVTTPRTPKPMRLTIDEETLAFLEARGEVTPPSGGYREISGKAYGSMSSSMTKIPIVAESVETLEMAGFSRETAEEVFDKFKQAREIDEHCSLERFACMWIEGRAAVCDACSPGDDYRAAWKYQGFTASRYESLLDPDFDMMRFTDSASGHFKRSVRATADYVFSMGKNAKAHKKLVEDAGREDSSP